MPLTIVLHHNIIRRIARRTAIPQKAILYIFGFLLQFQFVCLFDLDVMHLVESSLFEDRVGVGAVVDGVGLVDLQGLG